MAPEKMNRGYFVTGTDTGVGKTLVSCALLHHFASRGLRAVGMKPVAAGCRRENGQLLSEDVAQLLAAGNVDVPATAINPYAFEPPLAPHIAARQAGVEIEFAPMLKTFANLQTQADVVVVEGVGGFRVPLNNHQDTADLAVALQLPVILVVGMRLGCLNHALLTSEAIAHAGLSLAGWVANQVDADMAAADANVSTLSARLSAPCLATVPYQLSASWERIVFPDADSF
jgi:dethiobiotin synthetase